MSRPFQRLSKHIFHSGLLAKAEVHATLRQGGPVSQGTFEIIGYQAGALFWMIPCAMFALWIGTWSHTFACTVMFCFGILLSIIALVNVTLLLACAYTYARIYIKHLITNRYID